MFLFNHNFPAARSAVGAFCKTPAVCAERLDQCRQPITGRFAKRPYCLIQIFLPPAMAMPRVWAAARRPSRA